MMVKNSKESKGCGFAKFSKASSAAIAMEQINEKSEKCAFISFYFILRFIVGLKIKVLIADPKTKRSKELGNIRDPFHHIVPGNYTNFDGDVRVEKVDLYFNTMESMVCQCPYNM